MSEMVLVNGGLPYQNSLNLGGCTFIERQLYSVMSFHVQYLVLESQNFILLNP